MSPRATLPGADELFRATGPAGLRPQPAPLEEAGRPPSGYRESDATQDREGTERTGVDPVPEALARPARATVRAVPRRRTGHGDRGPTGRERHEEKITVYVSSDELLDLERARLNLRAEHGLAVDRGRVVREALGIVLADLESKGESSILVRRLRGQ